jgi:hypothetical protein
MLFYLKKTLNSEKKKKKKPPTFGMILTAKYLFFLFFRLY